MVIELSTILLQVILWSASPPTCSKCNQDGGVYLCCLKFRFCRYGFTDITRFLSNRWHHTAPTSSKRSRNGLFVLRLCHLKFCLCCYGFIDISGFFNWWKQATSHKFIRNGPSCIFTGATFALYCRLFLLHLSQLIITSWCFLLFYLIKLSCQQCLKFQ